MSVPSTEDFRVLFFFTFRIRISRDAGLGLPRQSENSGFSTCRRHEYFLISCAMHSVYKRMNASHVHEATTGATYLRVFGTHTGCTGSGARRQKTFSLFCMHTRKLQGLCCRVWELPTLCIRSRSHHSSASAAQSAPLSPGPLQDPAAAATYGTHWGDHKKGVTVIAIAIQCPIAMA